jgi:hypothetical protein
MRGSRPISTSDDETRIPRPMPPAGGGGVRERDARGVAPWVEVEQGRAGGADRGTGREALQPARDEEPRGGVREQEEHGRAEQPGERREEHGAAADVVGDAAGDEQGREHAEGVRRVDQGQRQRREVPEHAVRAIERRRRHRGEQPEADHARGDSVARTV